MFYQRKDYSKNLLKLKDFEQSPLGSELKKQTVTGGRQCQGLKKVYEFGKTKKMRIKHQTSKNIINKI